MFQSVKTPRWPLQPVDGEVPQARSNGPSRDWEAGRSLMQQALAEGGLRTGLLNRALKHFQAELKRNPAHHLACLGCAGLLLLAEQRNLARRYARRALEIHPKHPDALRLLSQIERLPLGGAHLTLEWDTVALADELESWCLTYTRRLMTQARFNELLSGPEPEPGLRQALLDELGQKLELAESYLDLIHRDFDIETLRQTLKPLLIYQRRLKQLLVQEAELQAFCQRCDAILLQIRRFDLRRQLEAGRQLEVLLDACDRLADDLDAYETRGLDISQMKPHYKRVLQQVEQLQDQVDDLAD